MIVSILLIIADSSAQSENYFKRLSQIDSIEQVRTKDSVQLTIIEKAYNDTLESIGIIEESIAYIENQKQKEWPVQIDRGKVILYTLCSQNKGHSIKVSKGNTLYVSPIMKAKRLLTLHILLVQ